MALLNRTEHWLQQGIGLRLQIVERQADDDGNGQERQSNELANLQSADEPPVDSPTNPIRCTQR